MNPADYDTYPVDAALVAEGLGQTLMLREAGPVRIADLIDVLQDAGVHVLVEGGAPRDWLRGAPAKDVDLAVDCGILRVHEVLEAAYPGVNEVRIRLDDFGMLRWGSGQASVDINILRTPDDLDGRPLSETRFNPSGSLYADSRMVDFSVNAFYYDCAAQVVLAPHHGSLDDLRHMRLRLISDPRKLAVDFRNSLRIAQFVVRGYEPTSSTMEYLMDHADRDVLGMGDMLSPWIGEHLSDRHARALFGAYLHSVLRTPESHERLSDALRGEGVAVGAWCPSGPPSA